FRRSSSTSCSAVAKSAYARIAIGSCFGALIVWNLRTRRATLDRGLKEAAWSLVPLAGMGGKSGLHRAKAAANGGPEWPGEAAPGTRPPAASPPRRGGDG